MANTYTQIYLHVVFAVSARACVIATNRREELQKYMTGIVTRQGQKLIAIYCRPDHTRALLGLKPDATPSELTGDLKTGSTNHINEQRWIGCRFSWQTGYGAFSGLPFAPWASDKLHLQPGIAPWPALVSRRIRHLSGAPRGFVRSEIPLQTDRMNPPHPHAAPTELGPFTHNQGYRHVAPTEFFLSPGRQRNRFA